MKWFIAHANDDRQVLKNSPQPVI